VVIASKPSNPAVVEKAQQDPQLPWFLTEVTAPFYTQLTDFIVADV